jgi:methyltransferase family protein
MTTDGRGDRRLKRILGAVGAFNLNALRILLQQGVRPAISYVAYAHRLCFGYAFPSPWTQLSWRRNLQIQQVPVQDVFSEIDFVHSPKILYPLPRDLSIAAHELIILVSVVAHMGARRVVEFGTAEGRTALNLALHLAPDGEVVTLDFPPTETNQVGYFYWDQPLKARIKQVFASVHSWDSTPYQASAEVVFCDACDQFEGLMAETAKAFAVVKPGGVIFRHDYGSAEGPTLFWNELAKELPVRHLQNTTLLCLRLDDPDVYAKTQWMLASGRFRV